MTELLKCPFCGGRSIMVKTQKCGRYVGCLDCGARTEEAETDYAGSAYDKAIAAWNRRTQPESEPLVRCGECIVPIIDCPAGDAVMLKTDFCSYGKRKPERSEG